MLLHSAFFDSGFLVQSRLHNCLKNLPILQLF